MIINSIRGVSVHDKRRAGLGRLNTIMSDVDDQDVANEIEYLRRMGFEPTAVVKCGRSAEVYISARQTQEEVHA